MLSPISGCHGARERPRKLRLFTVSLVVLLGASADVADRRDEQWRSAIRQALFVADSLPELLPRAHGRFEPARGVVAERVTYGTQFGMRVPAILYLPQPLPTEKIPALVVVNGHGGDKYSWYSFYTGILYARAGAAVLTYDPTGEGERNAERKSGTRAHDKVEPPPELALRLTGLMVTDVMQAVSYLSQRPEVDPRRIAGVGYSLGSFVLAMAGALDSRLRASVLVGGGNLDGPGEYWDNTKPMCTGTAYRSLQPLGDRAAIIYALHASRGPALVYNGLEDDTVRIPKDARRFFSDLQGRVAALRGTTTGVFDVGFVPGVGHRPFFVTAPVASWLERQLDFPNWTPAELSTMSVTHISGWATANGVEMDPLYASEHREGGIRALGGDVPGLGRADLSVFGDADWERHKPLLVHERWREHALAQITNGEWRHYGGDAGGTKFSPLSQIDRDNVRDLEVAWSYHSKDVSDGTRYPSRSAFETTPQVVDGTMYLTTPFDRAIALDAETGREKWAFDPGIDKSRRYNLLVNRGLAFWRNETDMRLFLGTLDGRLFALDARTGQPIPTFGTGGFVDLRRGIADTLPDRVYGMTSPPLVCKDLVMTGAATGPQAKGPGGDVRAFDVRTGKLVWRFHTVPRPGEAGHETWEADSWRSRGGVNVWSVMSCDEERGIAYLPIATASADHYGGDRKGKNLFANSLVALKAETGKRLWHFQTVHHDIWDYDLPAQPALLTLPRTDRGIPAVALVTKTGFIYVFDRVTGAPLFEIEERPVPPSDVPGEQAWRTQPVPVKPPAVARQSFSLDEITNVTPESRAECLGLLENARIGQLFSPPGLQYTVVFPGQNGGANWGGAAWDPSTSLLFVNTMDVGQVVKMIPGGSGYETAPFRNGRFWDSNQYPCQQPPWGALTAVDLRTGSIRWRATLGVVDELIKRGVPPTGAPNLGGPLVTAGGLVFIAATNDRRFRAFDKETGRELWTTELPASGHATPMTFLGRTSGRQFVAIAAGGGNKYNRTFGDTLVVFALRSASTGRNGR